MTAQLTINFALKKLETIMNTKYTIKNFRVFDEKGSTVDIKPITILTGCNNSGKSSIVKSMVLFDSIVGDIHRDYAEGKKIHLDKYKLNFTTKKTSSLGNFNRVIHNGSTDKTIEFHYRIFSKLLGDYLTVKFTFASDDHSLEGLKEGYIAELEICKDDNEIIFLTRDFDFDPQKRKDREQFCLKSLYNNFYRFVLGQYLLVEYRNHETCCRQFSYSKEKGIPYNGMNKEELEEEEHLLRTFERQYREKYGDEALKNIITLYNHNCANSFKEKYGRSTLMSKFINNDFDVIAKSRQFRTLFYSSTYEKLSNVSRQSFREAIESMKQGKGLGLELEFAIEEIIKDYENSDYETFGKYFESKETDFMTLYSQLIGEEYWGILKNREGKWIDKPSLNYYLDMKIYAEGEKTKKGEIDFLFLYVVIMNLDSYYNIDGDKYYTQENNDRSLYPVFYHPIFDMFMEYVNDVIEDAICRSLPYDLSYVSTSVINVKRIYPLDADDYFTQMLKQYLDMRKVKNRFPCDMALSVYPGEFINKWVRKLNIGYRIGIPEDEEGLGTTVRLYKDKDDNKGAILAEQGYGISQLFVILMRIETAILGNITEFETVYEDELYMGNDTENHIFKNRISDYTIAIEEPEVHLHPKLQSMLAEILVDAYTSHNIHFVIETHSEYIIRKLQLLVANKQVNNSDISIIYVYDEKDRPGYEPQVKKIGIRKDGMLNGNFGEGFFDEADMLSMFLLTAGGNEDE